MLNCYFIFSLLLSGLFLFVVAVLTKQLGNPAGSCLTSWLQGKNSATANRQLGVAILILGVAVSAAIKRLSSLDASSNLWAYDIQHELWLSFSAALGAVFISNGYVLTDTNKTTGDTK